MALLRTLWPAPLGADAPLEAARPLRALTLAAAGSRVCVLVWVLFSDAMLPDHAAGVRVFSLDVDGRLPDWLLRGCTRWDSAHMLGVAVEGYVDETDAAWFPAYPLLVRGVAAALRRIVGLAPRESCVVAGILISNVAFVLAARSVYRAALAFEGGERALKVALIFCWTPAGVFCSVCYSESLFAAFAFHGVAALLEKRAWAATAAFACAAMTRSNGCLFALLLLAHGFAQVASHYAKTRKLRIPAIVTTVFQCIVVAAPPLFVDLWSYRRRCFSDETRGAWCDAAVPSLYRHVQREHWGVGPFEYWQFKQLPNFLLAAPALFIAAHAVHNEVRRCNALSGAWWPSAEWWSSVAPMRLALAAHTAVIALLVLCVAHVEIATRLLAAASFPFHVALAQLLERQPGPVMAYLVVYNVVGAAAHANFLPWT